jgi:type II secretory pathway pseudopilin PulG
MKTRHSQTLKRSASNQEGYMLLAVMLLITLMLVALAIEAPRIVQQIQRQKEEELIHRGKEYAVAIKKFYHKNGTYPVSLDQLEKTNNFRFLRHRYKDPMTAAGEWKLIHVGEAQIAMPVTAGGSGTQGPGQLGSMNTNAPGASPGMNSATPTSPGGLNSGGFNSGGLNQGGFNQGGFNQGGLNSGGMNPGGLNSGGLNSGGQNPGGLTGSTPAGGQGVAGGPQGGPQMGTLQTSNIGTGLGANAQGGGPIIGVASTSKGKGIKEFNGNSEYASWLFVYDPRLEQGPGGGGVTVASPRSANPTNGAVPAGVVSAPQPNGTPPPQPGMVTAPSSGVPSPTPQPQQPGPTPTPQTIPQ